MSGAVRWAFFFLSAGAQRDRVASLLGFAGVWTWFFTTFIGLAGHSATTAIDVDRFSHATHPEHTACGKTKNDCSKEYIRLGFWRMNPIKSWSKETAVCEFNWKAGGADKRKENRFFFMEFPEHKRTGNSALVVDGRTAIGPIHSRVAMSSGHDLPPHAVIHRYHGRIVPGVNDSNLYERPGQ